MINTSQKRKILTKIQSISKDIEILKQVRLEVATSGYASATLSSGGGSQSYTRTNLNDITKAIMSLENELEQYSSMLTNSGNPLGLYTRKILHVYQ